MDLAEAKRVFMRRAEDVLEQAEGIRLGLQVIQTQDQMIQQQMDKIKELESSGPQKSSEPLKSNDPAGRQ